uniref:Integrase catalytic domain-containing protein n=1 Tax=Tanacetum cinerariifolium TaxID=118510 RepID=A0A699GM36_TANCI|nr:hypothetical protein [Tanacetum cinerariifolium]
MRPMRSNMNAARPNRTSFNKPAHSYTNRPFQRKSAVRSQYKALWVPTVNRNFPSVNRKFSTGSRNFPTANRKFPTASRKFPTSSTKFSTADMGMKGKADSSQNNIDDKGYWDSGCSRHITGNISYLSDYEPFNGGYVSFGQEGCKITRKGTIKTGKLEFENVYFVKDLKGFKLLDDANVLLRTPRQHNMYSIDLNNIVSHKDLTCLVAKASADECMIWHRRLGIKREFSNARTPQQNGVAERRNRTLIEAARTMLADAKLPVTFWAEAVNTGFLKPFGCHVMILNTLENLGKVEAKGDEGYFIGYLMSSKAFRVFNKKTKRVKENLHIEFLENKAIEKGAGPNWLFDIDSLTKSMNYLPVVDVGTNSTNFLGTKDVEGQEVKKDVSTLRYIALPNWAHDAFLESSLSKCQDDCNTDVPESSGNTNLTATLTIPSANQVETLTVESPIPTASSPVPTACFTDAQEPSSETRLISKRVANQEETPSLDNILTLTNRFEDILGVTTNSEESNRVKADVSNLETTITASPTPTLRNHKDHPKSQIIGPVDTPIQTRNKFKDVGEQGFIAIIHQKTDPDPSWVEAMQEEPLQFKIQKVWTLVDCPKGVTPIGIKWVLKNKKDERGIVIRNKARLVAQGHTQEEGIDYDEVFTLVVRIEAIRLFLAYASIIGFTDPEYPARVYKFKKLCMDYIRLPELGMLCREFEALMHEKFQMSATGELNFFLGLQVLQKEDGIFLSQDKYVGDILKKFRYSDVRSSNTPMDKENPWGKDGTEKDVYLHLYSSMIGSLMYLTASRPDIMFAGHPKLRLWYPKDSPFDSVAYSDNDYGGATQDRKSTTGGCQFFGRRLISWQCKKQTIVATSTTKAEYVAAASCCRQVL